MSRPAEGAGERIVRIDTDIDGVADDISAGVGGNALAEIAVASGHIHPRAERNDRGVHRDDAFIGGESRSGGAAHIITGRAHVDVVEISPFHAVGADKRAALGRCGDIPGQGVRDGIARPVPFVTICVVG